MARPKKQKELHRGKRVYVRYSNTEYELISSHAKDLGCPIGTFVRRCTLDEKLEICCYLSFAILPQPVPAPYFSGVFSGKTRRMHIQCQKYLSGMAYSVFKELRKVLFSNPYTNMNLKGPWGIQFSNIF